MYAKALGKRQRLRRGDLGRLTKKFNKKQEENNQFSTSKFDNLIRGLKRKAAKGEQTEFILGSDSESDSDGVDHDENHEQVQIDVQIDGEEEAVEEEENFIPAKKVRNLDSGEEKVQTLLQLKKEFASKRDEWTDKKQRNERELERRNAEFDELVAEDANAKKERLAFLLFDDVPEKWLDNAARQELSERVSKAKSGLAFKENELLEFKQQMKADLNALRVESLAQVTPDFDPHCIDLFEKRI